MTTRTSQYYRTTAILELIDYWIGQHGEDFDCGALIEDADFSLLLRQVQEMKDYARSAAWRMGISKWVGCIEYATKNFFQVHAGFDEQMLYAITENGNDGFPTAKDFTTNTGREYHRLFKWALMMGAQYAQIGNH
jgi:hypothetical protein